MGYKPLKNSASEQVPGVFALKLWGIQNWPLYETAAPPLRKKLPSGEVWLCQPGPRIWNGKCTRLPSSKLTWLAGKSSFCIGDTSSNGCYSIEVGQMMLNPQRCHVSCGSSTWFLSVLFDVPPPKTKIWQWKIPTMNANISTIKKFNDFPASHVSFQGVKSCPKNWMAQNVSGQVLKFIS